MNDFDNNGYDPKNLQVVFFTLLFGQIVFLFITIYLLKNFTFLYQLSDLTFTLIPLAALLLDYLGNKYFISGFTKLTAEEDLQKSMQQLNRIHLVRWIFVQAATMLLITFTFIYANHFFTAFAAINIIYFATLRPRLFTFNEGF